MKTKYLFIKRGLFSSILILIILLSHANAIDDRSGKINDTISDNKANEYFLIVNDEPVFTNNFKNIIAGEKLEFRIFDNSTKKFVTDGTIILENKSLNITQHGLIEDVKDKLKGIFSDVVGGDDTWGNNSEFFGEYLFEETSNNYTMNAIGEYSSIRTNNKITINVKTKYVTRMVGNIGKAEIYQLISLKSLNNRNLTYHKEKYAQNADSLIKNMGKFIDTSYELQNKISNLTSNSDKNELENLSIGKVLDLQVELDKSIKSFESKIENDLLKEPTTTQLNLINKDLNNVTSELTINLNIKKDNLLKKELKDAEDQKNKKESDLSVAKTDFRSEVFYPAGLLVILGFIIGYFNVNRWKKESEYFGLYTSKANIMSPITLALIITIIILILVGGVVYFENSLGMFKFLIL